MGDIACVICQEPIDYCQGHGDHDGRWVAIVTVDPDSDDPELTQHVFEGNTIGDDEAMTDYVERFLDDIGVPCFVTWQQVSDSGHAVTQFAYEFEPDT